MSEQSNQASLYIVRQREQGYLPEQTHIDPVTGERLEQPFYLDGYVFLSYSHRDRQKAEELQSLLEKNRVPVWIDNHGIKVGDIFKANIVSAIDNSSLFVVMISEPAIRSRWVRREVKRAAKQRKPLWPIQYNRTSDKTIRRLKSIQHQPLKKAGDLPHDSFAISACDFIRRALESPDA